MATLDAIRPYVEQFFDDDEVQSQLSRAAGNLRAARSRAGKAKSKKKLVQDEHLRRRVIDALSAAVAAGSALSEAPKKRHRGRRRALFVLVLAGAGAFIATNPEARARVEGLLGMSGQEA